MDIVKERSGRARRRLLTAAVVVAVLSTFVTVLYQPWIAQWGSTAAERRSPVAGDDMVADPISNWTRAITIDAPPAQVWPWLVQIGADKGGFYTFDWAEQLAGDGLHNATRVHPEWQSLRVGDEVHPFPTAKGYWKVAAVETDRLLVLGDEKWTWATELRPLPDGRTRLVARVRAAGNVTNRLLDPEDLIVFPRILVGLEQRAEGTLPGMPGTHTGQPFPIARLPVYWWAALGWVAGLALFAAAFRRVLGFGDWGRTRRHPHLTFWTGLVIGAGYMLMSDMPPVQFFTHTWGLGLLLGTVIGVGVAKRAEIRVPPTEGGRRRRLSRAVVAFVESGLFVVLPVTAVWQAATARGWTTSVLAHLAVGSAGALVAVAVATVAWGPGQGVRRAAWTSGLLAVGYAMTGSGIAALLAALLAELVRPHTRIPVPAPSAGPHHVNASRELSTAAT